ncbi:MAG: type II toxin-antitoxin system RelE/ParE family toxin [Deltaproteobacteria bacterium]|nr:type II toxin-antitoxin system RelE/ParE family toxin [Deltaproteobacteria bacterium]
MKPVRFHKKVETAIEELDAFTKAALADQFQFLARGQSLGPPVSRPMPIVAHGVHELRLKGKGGQYRIFYYTKYKDAILVFHMFKKKTQQTPDHEIEVAKRRLGEMI